MRWVLADPDAASVGRLICDLGICEATAKVLVNRGVTVPEVARGYLSEPMNLLNDPYLFSGMEKAVDRIKRAVVRGEPILIYGDYDADGITGSALLYLFLKEMGAEVEVFIPDRFRHGYGLTREALRDLGGNGFRLLVTVDCGITSVVEVASLVGSGIDVIITDHHTPGALIPDALAVINPKLDAGYPFKDLAGVGVAMKLVEALAQEFGGSQLRRAVLKRFLPLVALGTVADVVPLIGENRFFVKYGLRLMGEHTGIRALMEAAGIKDRQLVPWDVSFILAPRINAPGRMSTALKSFRLLITEDEAEAESLAMELSRENSARQREEERVVNEALDRYRDLGVRLAFIWGEGWHPGVIGIAASKVARRLAMPAILVSFFDSDRVGRGSGRSYGGVDLYGVVSRASSCMISFGGHRQAVGFSVERERLEEVVALLVDAMSGVRVEEDLLKVDAVLELEDLEVGFLRELLQLAPFGEGFEEPLFMFRNLRVRFPKEMSNGGLMFEVVKGKLAVDVVSFDPISLSSGDVIDMVASVELSEWRGKKRLRLRCKDAGRSQ